MSENQRYTYIDWMKVIGIYLIVCGHFSQPRPPFIAYIYVFNVPLFFIISGFLFRKETDIRLFWRKLWKNLLLPMLSICFFLWCYDSFISLVRHEPFVMNDIPVRFWNILTGIQSDNRGNGLQVCWFIYTLAILKILMQYIPQRILLLFIMPLSLSFIIIASMQETNFLNRSAIIISVLCLPFFMLGYLAKLIDFPKMASSNRTLYLLGTVTLLITIIIGYHNGPAWVYQCQFGKDFTLYFLGGEWQFVDIYHIAYSFQI